MQEMIDFLNANIQQEGGVKRYLEKVKQMYQQNPDFLKEWNYSSLIQFIFDYPNLEKVHPDFWLILAALLQGYIYFEILKHKANQFYFRLIEFINKDKNFTPNSLAAILAAMRMISCLESLAIVIQFDFGSLYKTLKNSETKNSTPYLKLALSFLAFRLLKIEEGKDYLTELAEKGNDFGQAYLAMTLKEIFKSSKLQMTPTLQAEKKNEIKKWFNNALQQNNTLARVLVGSSYAEYVENPALVLNTVKSVAEEGHAGAQNQLGRWYSNGSNLKQNYTEAFRWIELAAMQGLPDAMCSLAVLYCCKNGIPASLSQSQINEAVYFWYKKAAEKGQIEAQNWLGYCYEKGIGDVPVDLALALQWYNKAAMQGHQAASQANERLFRQLQLNSRTVIAPPPQPVAKSGLSATPSAATTSQPRKAVSAPFWKAGAHPNPKTEAQALYEVAVDARSKAALPFNHVVDLLIKAAAKGHSGAQQEVAEIRKLIAQPVMEQAKQPNERGQKNPRPDSPLNETQGKMPRREDETTEETSSMATIQQGPRT